MDIEKKSPGKTADGVEIVEGLVVFTNEMQVGVVRLGRHRASDDGWFDVEYAPDADGYSRRVMQNGDRVATRFEGRSAQKRWDEQTAI